MSENKKSGTRKCVYTVVTGNYENLNTGKSFPDSEWDYICLTDNRNLTSDTWQVRYFDPPFTYDHARNSRLPKTCPHRFLPEYDVSLYIDNTVTLKVAPEVIEAELFPEAKFEWAAFGHSTRRSLLGEFNRVLKLELDEPTRILEQFISYRKERPDLLLVAPIWAGFMLRRHHSKDVIAAGERWYAHILRYSRRDQLSLPYALADHVDILNLLGMDNRNSSLHTWNNKTPSRDTARRYVGWKEMLPSSVLAYYKVMRLVRKIFNKKLAV